MSKNEDEYGLVNSSDRHQCLPKRINADISQRIVSRSRATFATPPIGFPSLSLDKISMYGRQASERCYSSTSMF